MNDAVETHMYRDYRIRILQDDSPESPREWDNLAIMVCFHRRYVLGDPGHGYDAGTYTSWTEMEADIVKRERPVVIKPLYLYDHSGITISTSPFSCPWDSGQIGFAWVPRHRVLKEWKCKRVTAKLRTMVEACLEAEVRIYDAYLRGAVFGYVIDGPTEDPDVWEENLDSCWGFYGEGETKADGYMVGQASNAIDAIIEARHRASLPENQPGQMVLAGMD